MREKNSTILSFVRICIPFLKLDLAYANLAYHQPKNAGFLGRIKSLQYNETLSFNWHYQSIFQGIVSRVRFRVLKRCEMLGSFLRL